MQHQTPSSARRTKLAKQDIYSLVYIKTIPVDDTINIRTSASSGNITNKDNITVNTSQVYKRSQCTTHKKGIQHRIRRMARAGNTTIVTVNNSTSTQVTTAKQPNDHNSQVSTAVLQQRNGNSECSIDNSSLIIPEIGTKQQEVKLYYKSQMTSLYKHEEECLRRIIQTNIEATDKIAKVKQHI